MTTGNEEQRISRIETMWSMVRSAQDDDSAESEAATRAMLDRYSAAVKKYLLGATHNEELADELFQEFALRFITGKYSSADADRGRFRSFLKTILFRLVAEHHRTKGREKSVPMDSQVSDPVATDSATVSADAGFNKAWSDELLKKAWATLEQLERRTGRPLFTIMRLKVEQPELRSADIATLATERTGKEVSTANARVILHRAREQFADFLVDEVQHSLETDDVERISEELQDLNLYAYCKPALERRSR